eukprot:2674672-Ditylum_brightwellii.AAC.1
MGMLGGTHTNGTFNKYIAVQLDHVKRILGYLQAAEVDIEYWIDVLNKGLVTIATDGSVANWKGYYATVMHTDQKQLGFQGPCYGVKSLMTSYCTELAGILTALYLLRALSSYFQMQINIKQTTLCNNTAAVSRTNTSFGPGNKHYTTTYYDIAKKIDEVKRASLDMQASWVKAHQEKKTAVDCLPLDAQLNICADVDVTSFRLHTPPHLKPSLTPISHQSAKVTIEINNTVVTVNLQQ